MNVFDYFKVARQIRESTTSERAHELGYEYQSRGVWLDPETGDRYRSKGNGFEKIQEKQPSQRGAAKKDAPQQQKQTLGDFKKQATARQDLVPDRPSSGVDPEFDAENRAKASAGGMWHLLPDKNKQDAIAREKDAAMAAQQPEEEPIEEPAPEEEPASEPEEREPSPKQKEFDDALAKADAEVEDEDFEWFSDIADGIKSKDTSAKERISLYMMREALENDRFMDDEDVDEMIQVATDKLGFKSPGQKMKMKKYLLSGIRQAKELKRWAKERGISSEKFKNMKYERVGDKDPFMDPNKTSSIFTGMIDDIMDNYLTSSDKRRLFGSRMKDTFNPTDLSMVSADKEQEIVDGYKKLMEAYPEDKQAGVAAISALIREHMGAGNIIPMSLKDTEGKDAELTEVNTRSLGNMGVQAGLLSLLGEAKLSLGVGEKSMEGKPYVDFDSSNFRIPVGIKLMKQLEDGEIEPEMIYALYESVASESGANASNQPKIKNLRFEPPGISDYDSDSGKFENRAREGKMPIDLFYDQIAELSDTPEGENPHLYRMGYEDSRNPSKMPKLQVGIKKALENGTPLTPAQKKTYEKYQDKMDNYNNFLVKDSLSYKDFDDSDVNYWAEKLEDLNSYNEDESNFREAPDGSKERGFVTDLSDVKIGNKSYKPGEYKEYFEDLFALDKMIRDEDKEGLKKRFGNDISPIMSQNVGLINRKVREALTRIKIASGMKKAWSEGRLKDIIGKNLMAAEKISSKKEDLNFPFLKLAKKTNIDPKQKGVKLEQKDGRLMIENLKKSLKDPF